MVSIADDELTADRAYLKEHEQVQTNGWVYYAFNVTNEDYQVVVNVAEEEDSQCKLLLSAQASCANSLYTHLYTVLIVAAYKAACGVPNWHFHSLITDQAAACI